MMDMIESSVQFSFVFGGQQASRKLLLHIYLMQFSRLSIKAHPQFLIIFTRLPLLCVDS